MAFAQRFTVTLDGTSYEITTRPSDMLDAEQALAREKITNPIESVPFRVQTRLVFAAMTRLFPDNPAARDWPKFRELLDDFDPIAEPGDAAVADDAMVPTRPVDSESWQ